VGHVKSIAEREAFIAELKVFRKRCAPCEYVKVDIQILEQLEIIRQKQQLEKGVVKYEKE
jgi:hypothetical protein